MNDFVNIKFTKNAHLLFTGNAHLILPILLINIYQNALNHPIHP